jgi:hypothetical protein
MPNTEILVFRDSEGRSEFFEWLAANAKKKQLRAKCFAKIVLLGNLGNELRRPNADFLRDGIYELRFQYRNVNYRVLYGFVGQKIALISHVTTKLAKVANKDINTAVQRLALAKQCPDTYTAEFDAPDGQNP